MNPKEKKDFAEIVGRVIDEKITPRLKKLEEKSTEHSRKLDATMEMVAKNSEDIEMLKEDFTDSGYTLERIETKLDATIRRQDDASVKTSQLARRVLRLESKKS